MDLVTHGAVGACIGWAFPDRKTGSAKAAYALCGALLPDIDYLNDPLVGLDSALSHRALTHSLCGIALLAPLAALLFYAFGKERRFARPLLFVALGMVSHILLDMPTPMGVKIFFPFYRHFVHLDFLSYLDWTLFEFSLFVLFAVWIYTHRETALRRGILAAIMILALSWWLYSEWPTLSAAGAVSTAETDGHPFRTVYPLVLGGTLLAALFAFSRGNWGFRQSRTFFGRAGILLFSSYLLFCVAAQAAVLQRVGRFTSEHHIPVQDRHVARMGFSSILGPFFWTGLVRSPEGVYRAQIALFSTRPPEFTLYSSSANNIYIAKTRSVPRVQNFISAARFLVTRCRSANNKQIVDYEELGLSWRPLLRVELNDNKEILSVKWAEH